MRWTSEELVAWRLRYFPDSLSEMLLCEGLIHSRYRPVTLNTDRRPAAADNVMDWDSVGWLHD